MQIKLAITSYLVERYAEDIVLSGNCVATYKIPHACIGHCPLAANG